MANSSIGLTAETLHQLLAWLAEDRDAAAGRYEEIRSRLIRIFMCRGCSAAEELADRTIDRVAMKIPRICDSYQGDPALYFYGVAQKIYVEYIKEKRSPRAPAPRISASEIESKGWCLETCMEQIPAHHRDLILSYYTHDGRGRIEARKNLAQRLSLEANTLGVRAHRIRGALRRCVSKCFGQQIIGRQKDAK